MTVFGQNSQSMSVISLNVEATLISYGTSYLKAGNTPSLAKLPMRGKDHQSREEIAKRLVRVNQGLAEGVHAARQICRIRHYRSYR